MSSKKETLVILTPGFAESEEDTTCLPFVQHHVKEIAKQYPDIEIVIVAFQYPFNKKEYLWNGHRVICGNGKNRGGLKRYRLWWKMWQELNHLKKTNNIIGLFSLWCTECALVGSYFGRVNNIQHYNWICGQDAKVSNKYVQYIHPKAEELIVISDFLKREFYKNHKKEPAHVIPVGIETNAHVVTEQKRNIDIIGVGSLIPLKQYDVFVEVVQVLVKEMPQLQALIYGKGPEEQRLKSMIENMGLKNNIELMGATPHNEVLLAMQRAKILLHPSAYEGLGAVCLEALNMGAYVISYVQPIDQVIPHWLHVSNKEEMIEQTKKLLNTPSLEHTSISPYTCSGSAAAIMRLFLG
jgi:glycosyltransferase involved in cell wall biosynthesis